MSQTRSSTTTIVVCGIALVALLGWKAAHPHYSIPTPAMDQTVRVGDVVLASRAAYGLRIPFTGMRLPATSPIQRGDVVAFHFPAGDTVLIGREDRTYYDMVREAAYTGQPLEGAIEARSVTGRTPYLKRCVAVAGDKVEIKGGMLYVNDQPEKEPEHGLKAWTVTFTTAPTQEDLERFISEFGAEFMMTQDKPLTYAIRMTREAALKFKSVQGVVSVSPFSFPTGYQMMPVANVFPNDLTHYSWNIDHMGPIHVPKKGDVLILNDSTLAQYSRLIGVYEGNKLEVREGKIYINGQQTTQYTCRQNYYWMMGDNRHNALDSRFWGFVPEDHLEAQITRVLWSWDSEHSRLRTERTMMPFR